MGNITVESWLTSYRVDWEYIPALSLDQIDKKKSLENQARLSAPLDTDRVVEMADRFESGVATMPIIVWRNGERYVVIDGNHRMAAYELIGKSSIEAYYVRSADKDLYIRDVLTRTANTLNGVPLSNEHRMAQAMYMMRLHNRSASEVAPLFGIKPNSLSHKVRETAASDRLVRLGRDPDWIAANERRTLWRIQSDKVFIALADLIHDVKMPQQRITDLLASTLAATSEDAQVAFVAQVRAESKIHHAIVSKGGGKLRRQTLVRDRLLKYLRYANDLLKKYPTAAGLEISFQTDADELGDLVDEIGRRTRAVVRQVI